ncbi:MAG TPA: 3-hydroxyacyl-CoA dehydrogenase NAD-binding domain-containing protein [Planctomycetota bacterium]|nr:3-hydroxyacyl-CoA dehydrogenase NAD-binding domain-containing protein [Planctomycetota bacterium]
MDELGGKSGSDTGFARVAVVGAGTMGAGIAQVFAAAGSSVRLIDVEPSALEHARSAIRSSLERFVKKGQLAPGEAEATLARIARSGRIEDGADAQLAVEAVVEREDTKAALLRQLDEITPPDTILASNTSSISITRLGAATGRPERVIGMHFMNPVPLMKLVEVVRGVATSEETAARVIACAEALGKVPVEAQDYPGFVSNRVLMPMINEAAFCLMEGVSTREGIDTVMKLGMNHPMGPLALADLIGLDVCVDILEVLQAGFGDPKYRPCPLLRRLVAAGRLGKKTGQGFYEYT